MAFDIAQDKKFPLYKTAYNAGMNLDSAKEYVRGEKDKDSLAFCSCIIGWEEFDKLKKVKEILTDAVESKGVARTIFNIIYQSSSLYDLSVESGDIFKSWRLVYHIARLKERHKNAKSLLDELIDQILENNNRLYKNTYLAARWAEFETRK